jgi:hypothetical protein
LGGGDRFGRQRGGRFGRVVKICGCTKNPKVTPNLEPILPPGGAPATVSLVELGTGSCDHGQANPLLCVGHPAETCRGTAVVKSDE